MTDPEPPVPFFLARPAAPPPWPGVVVLMEGTGVGPQLLRVCERLAAEGYVTAAPDLFHRLGGSDPARFLDQLRELRSADAVRDTAACAVALRELGASKIGVTGFCMGGRLTYEAALADIGIEAAAGFYGAGIGKLLGTPRCPTILFFGGEDEYVPRDEIAAVQAHHPGDVVLYEDAQHGFMRDGSDTYHPTAAVDAWNRLLTFFREHLV